jgi:hypothetical protein
MTGSHIRWVRREAESEDPERIAIREALAFGKAVYDRRVNLNLSVADLALRVGILGLAGEGDDLLGELVRPPRPGPGRDQRRQAAGLHRGGRLVVRRSALVRAVDHRRVLQGRRPGKVQGWLAADR